MARISEILSEFNESEWQAIHEYLVKWGNSKYCKGDLPEYGTDFAICYNIPIAMVALKNAEETGKLNEQLIRLNWILIALTAFLVLKEVWAFVLASHL